MYASTCCTICTRRGLDLDRSDSLHASCENSGPQTKLYITSETATEEHLDIYCFGGASHDDPIYLQLSAVYRMPHATQDETDQTSKPATEVEYLENFNAAYPSLAGALFAKESKRSFKTDHNKISTNTKGTCGSTRRNDTNDRTSHGHRAAAATITHL